MGLLVVAFGAVGSISYAKKLMHRGPVYIISPDGIMDCRFGFIPWSQVTKISTDIRGPLPTDAIIHISGVAPEYHFKSRWRPYFGARLISISLSPKIMRYEYLDNETNQLT